MEYPTTEGISFEMEENQPLVNQKNYAQCSISSYYTWSSVFRRPSLSSLSDEGSDQNKLSRTLGIWDLIGYGIAGTVGTGIFVTVGQVANKEAGPAIIFSFLFAGIASLLSALCYSEFATRIPVSGSAYSFAYISLGEIVGWFVGWNLTLEYAFSASAVSRGWTGYLDSALQNMGYTMPRWLVGYNIFPSLALSLSPLSSAVCIGCTIILLFGIKDSSRFNMVITAINIVVIFFVIILGSFYVDSSNYNPFFPYGIQGTWNGVATVFFSYIGFDSVTTLAGEVKNPERALPLGVVGTLIGVTVLYISVGLVVTGMVPYAQMSTSAPLSEAFSFVGLKWASIIIGIASVTTMTATTLCSLIGQPRIFFQMAKDGLIFPIFSRVNLRTGVPVEGTIITGSISALITFCFSLDSLISMISIGTLLAFTVVCAGVIIIRYRNEDTAEHSNVSLFVFLYVCACFVFGLRNWLAFDNFFWWPYSWIFFALFPIFAFVPLLGLKPLPISANDLTFRCPLVPWIPSLGILMNVWFIMSLPVDSFYRLLIWTTIGMLIYFGYGIRHSVLISKIETPESITESST